MRPFLRIAPLACSLAAGAILKAQQPDSGSVARALPVLLGTSGEDERRLAQLRGDASTAGWLMRTSSGISDPLSSRTARSFATPPCVAFWDVVRPVAAMTWNSRLPVERNDGGVWSGRGLTISASAGARIRCGRLSAQFVPSAWYARNAPFPFVASGAADRSGFASPFHANGGSMADIPVRFGERPLLVIEPGESVVEVDAGLLTVGAGTESQWWGPGIRNGLVMSNHAGGIPAVHFRTTKPVRLPLGAAEARWIVGGLSESPYFDTDGRNDLRSLSGLVVVLRPAFDSTLSLGWSRVVYAPIPGAGALPARFFDAVARWGEGADTRAATSGRGAEQFTNLFARWVVPEKGVEVYGDWARVILPKSLRSLLVAPQLNQGFTIGTQFLLPRDAGMVPWRAQVEFTMLEQPISSRANPPASFYTSPVVPQGYTQRGQVIGAAIGPGSSSQWVALDRLASAFRVGAFIGRIRWDNDAYFLQSTGYDKYAHDVDLFGGFRGGRCVRSTDLDFELLAERRLNYQFQNSDNGFGVDRTFDVPNMSLRFALAPAACRAR